MGSMFLGLNCHSKANRCFLVLAVAIVGLWGGICVAGNPMRVASLSLASDEILLELAPRCGGVQRMVALSTFVDDEQMSHVIKEAKSVKSRVHSEPESLFSLKPDFIFAASFNRPDLLKMLKASKIPYVILDRFSKVQDISDNIVRIAEAMGCKDEGQKLSNAFTQQVNEIRVSSLPKKLRVISYSQDLTVMGKDTLFDDMVARSGAINVASELGLSHWPRIETERLVKSQPDVVIVLGEDTKLKREAIRSHGAWKQLKAVQEGKLIFIDEKSALSTSHFFARSIIDLNRKLLERTQR